MRIFTRVRSNLVETVELRLAIEEIRKKTENNTKNIEVVFDHLDGLLEEKASAEPRKEIGYPMPGKKLRVI
jgi:hypothetical protein